MTTIDATDYPPHDEDAYPTPAEPLTLSVEAVSLDALDLANAALDLARAITPTYPGCTDLRLTAEALRDRIDAEHPRTFRTDLEPAQPYAVLDLYREAVEICQRARLLHHAYRNA